MTFVYFGELLLKVKARLPLNGDWLFVTASAAGEETDVAEEYDSPGFVLDRFSKTVSLDVAKIIYERIKTWEDTVRDTANRVYDKAKTIFGAASFASTILLVLSTTFLPPLLASPPWLRSLGIAFSLLLVVHLTRSLISAAGIMTRELLVREGPEELIGLSGMDELGVLKELGSKILAYSIQTRALGLEKLNKLIVAQHSFRYALIFYFALAILSFVAHLGEVKVENRSTRASAEEIVELKGRIEAIGRRQAELASLVERLERENLLAHRALEESIARETADLETFRVRLTKAEAKSAARKPSIGARRKP